MSVDDVVFQGGVITTMPNLLPTPDFDAALKFVRLEEGGISDHPEDPGKLTNLGVPRKTLSRWLGRRASRKEVRELTPATARLIFKAYYWKPIRGDELPSLLSIAVFDCAINQGPNTAVRLLQRVVGAVVDGIIGPRTLEAVQRAWKRDPEGVLVRFLANRALHYSGLLKVVVFGRGWYRRLFRLQARVLLDLWSFGRRKEPTKLKGDFR